jgi:hypothetical protein
VALFIRILEDGSFTLGPLPPFADRLDTGQKVDPREWLYATGFVNVETATLADLEQIPVELTAEQTAAAIAAVQEARQRKTRADQFIEDLQNDAAAYKSDLWDALDAYGAPPVPGSPNAGIAWGPLTAAQKAEVLRTWQTRATLGDLRLIDTVLLIIDVVADLREAVDVDPPT